MEITEETRQMSFEEMKMTKEKRYEIILNNLTVPMTAKELAVKLCNKGIIPTSERNFTAPRLSELEYQGKAKVIGKKKCEYTGKVVGVYEKI